MIRDAIRCASPAVIAVAVNVVHALAAGALGLRDRLHGAGWVWHSDNGGQHRILPGDDNDCKALTVVPGMG